MVLWPPRDLKIPKIIGSVANSENLCYSEIANARSPGKKGASYMLLDTLISLIIKELKRCKDEELLDYIWKLLISENRY